jgi:AcrR family transcriptional regulator
MPAKREPNARGAGDRLRSQLVDAASELLLRPQPLAAPSLRAVARACNVSPAAVYLHFESQQSLIWAVIENQLDALRTDLPRLDDPELPLTDRMRRFAEGYVSWGIAHPGAYQLIFESADQLGLEAHEGGPGWDLILGAAALIAEAGELDETEAELMATRVWVALHGLVSLRIHKAGLQWPTTAADEARGIVGMHLAALADTAR